MVLPHVLPHSHFFPSVLVVVTSLLVSFGTAVYTAVLFVSRVVVVQLIAHFNGVTNLFVILRQKYITM